MITGRFNIDFFWRSIVSMLSFNRRMTAMSRAVTFGLSWSSLSSSTSWRSSGRKSRRERSCWRQLRYAIMNLNNETCRFSSLTHVCLLLPITFLCSPQNGCLQSFAYIRHFSHSTAFQLTRERCTVWPQGQLRLIYDSPAGSSLSASVLIGVWVEFLTSDLTTWH